MPKPRSQEDFVGRRLRLRDLHVFLEVVQSGSMAKAAARLGVSQPAVSEVIAGLEHALSVRLLDRSSQGVQPTVFGQALVKRAIAAFDELHQGMRDIEVLADPSAGALRIGCAESVASAILPPIIQRFTRQYPRVVLQVDQVTSPGLDLPQLRARSIDLVLARIVQPTREDAFAEELDVEVLFEDQPVLAAGARSRWARARRIDLADLVEEPWILTPPTSWTTKVVAEAFHSRGLKMPHIALVTYSIHLRANLLANGDFIAVFPRTVLHLYAKRFSLKLLPVHLPTRPSPIALVTLKNRTLSAAAHRFMEHVRGYARSMTTAPGS
jgi:DNA-binding transcriptional LysR family regulator